jgi:hypothetical protein
MLSLPAPQMLSLPAPPMPPGQDLGLAQEIRCRERSKPEIRPRCAWLSLPRTSLMPDYTETPDARGGGHLCEAGQSNQQLVATVIRESRP